MILMIREDDVICTTVNEDLTFNLFSKAQYLVLIKNGGHNS